MPHLLATAGRTLGKQYIINRVGISLRSPGLMKNVVRHLMTTGEENLGFTSHLKPSAQNIKRSNTTPKPHTNYSFHSSICLWTTPQRSLRELWDLFSNGMNKTAPCDHSSNYSGEKLAEYQSLHHFPATSF